VALQQALEHGEGGGFGKEGKEPEYPMGEWAMPATSGIGFRRVDQIVQELLMKISPRGPDQVFEREHGNADFNAAGETAGRHPRKRRPDQPRRVYGTFQELSAGVSGRAGLSR
jgi:hypothetical protein